MRKAERVLASLVVALATASVAGQGQLTPPPRVTSLADAQLFDDTVLQRIELQVNTRDWATLRANYQLNTYYPATFLWRGQAVRNVGIRSRGSGTRNGQKPGLLVDFDRYVGGQRFLGLKALVLDNHLQDPSAMREALTMAVHAKLGLPAPREALAEVYINGEFFGVYTLVENLDSVAMARIFGGGSAPPLLALPPPAGARPAPTQPDPTPQLPAAKPRVPAPATSAPAPESDGYLYEYNWLDYFYGTYPGIELQLYTAMLEAETREDESLEALYRPIERLFREVNEAPDDRFVERVGPLLDLEEYVRLAAVQAYMADNDGIVGSYGMNNFYLYRPAEGGAHRIVPWDEDNAFRTADYPIDAEHARHVFMGRAMRVPELRDLFVRTLESVVQLAEARETAEGQPWLEREVTRRHALVAVRMQQDRVTPHSQADVSEAVSFNLDFARRRGNSVRDQLRRLRQ